MRILIDTNIFLWFAFDSSNLPQNMKKKIESEQNDVFLSIASLWEIGIKYSLKKLELKNKNLQELFKAIEDEFFISTLNISSDHILYSSELPIHHRDPFDRLIFAQSVVENLEFLYTDKIFDQYKRVK